MTTIAYRDGVMAADTQVTAGNSVCYFTSKLRRTEDGWLFGAAGTCAVAAMLLDWLVKNHSEWPVRPPSDFYPIKGDDTFPVDGLAVSPDGRVWWIGLDYFYEAKGEFFAAGSGAQYAMGAMQEGASAARAVAVARIFDGGTGGDIEAITLTKGEETP